VDCVKFHQLTAFLKWKIHRKAFAAGAPPRIPLGELTTLPQTPSRLGRGNPLPRPHPTRRLRRLEFSYPPNSSYFPPNLGCLDKTLRTKKEKKTAVSA